MPPLIITGMHRSGTSAIARMIQGLGLDLGSNLLPASENNLHGHFEEMAFIAFHDRLIARFFTERAPFCEWLPLADAAVACTPADHAEARSIWDAHRAAGGAAWKDPRTSLFLDLWKEVLPDAKFIICVRHPYQVHLSLLRRGEPFLHADYSAGLRGGTIYNRRIARVLAAVPRERFVVVDVEQAFREPRVLAARLAEFLDTPLREGSSNAIAPGDFHFEVDMGAALEQFPAWFPDAAAAFDALKQFDLLQPLAAHRAALSNPSDIEAPDARLIEFEQRNGLRGKTRKMLVRSIEADRRRISEFNRLSAELDAEKDRLIDDLSRFNEQLKQEVLRQRQAR